MGCDVEQTNDYCVRVLRVAAYLSEHLDDDFDLARLAKVASFSPYHFHRIYRALQGETVGDTLRRLRLHRAAVELIDGEYGVERIAKRAGYGSQAAFSRAFRTAYGEPPARYRGSKQQYFMLTQEERDRSMFEVKIEERAPLPIAFLEHRGDYQKIGKTYERIGVLAAKSGIFGPSTRMMGMYYDDPTSTPVEELRARVCFSAPQSFRGDEELQRDDVPGGKYATLVFVGPYAELKTAYDWLYGVWLPSSGQEPIDGPCVEEYLNDPRVTPPSELRTSLSLPLRG